LNRNCGIFAPFFQNIAAIDSPVGNETGRTQGQLNKQGISMNIAVSGNTRANLFALRMVSDQIDSVQTRLATGKRVNSAYDDPAAFFTSSGLSARAASLNQLVDNVSTVKKTIDAASNGVQAITSLLNQAQTIATAALQSANTLVKVTGNNASALTASTVIASAGGSSTKFKAGDTVTVNDGTTTATYTAANNDTVQTLLNAINGTANLKVTASLNSSGQIAFAATGAVSITIGGVQSGSGTLNGISGLTAGTTAFVANATRTSYGVQYDALRTQIDAAISDASYNGVNLLINGSKTIALNETGSSSIALIGANLSTTSLGVVASTNSFQADTDITNVITNITNALTTLQTQTATLGNNQAIIDARVQFNKSMADTLQSGADDLVKSDSGADGALLLALQTRQQLAATALSMTGSSDKMALRLFGLA
jgi:flagellin-like hook-associated protein FlgL